MNLSIDFVGGSPSMSECSDVSTLRMQEYATASGFYLDLSYLKWREADDQSHVMVVRDAKRMIATMRGEVIDHIELLEKKLECSWDLPFTPLGPVLLLSRAATSSQHRGRGLNLLMRYWFLKFAVHHDIRYVMGTFVSGSPRESTLHHLGYEFFEHKLGWQQSTFRSERPVHIVALDLQTQSARALAYCEKHLLQDLAGRLLGNDFPSLKLVGLI